MFPIHFLKILKAVPTDAPKIIPDTGVVTASVSAGPEPLSPDNLAFWVVIGAVDTKKPHP
jgi:hypothetical protein